MNLLTSQPPGRFAPAHSLRYGQNPGKQMSIFASDKWVKGQARNIQINFYYVYLWPS